MQAVCVSVRICRYGTTLTWADTRWPLRGQRAPVVHGLLEVQVPPFVLSLWQIVLR